VATYDCGEEMEDAVVEYGENDIEQDLDLAMHYVSKAVPNSGMDKHRSCDLLGTIGRSVRDIRRQDAILTLRKACALACASCDTNHEHHHTIAAVLLRFPNAPEVQEEALVALCRLPARQQLGVWETVKNEVNRIADASSSPFLRHRYHHQYRHHHHYPNHHHYTKLYVQGLAALLRLKCEPSQPRPPEQLPSLCRNIAAVILQYADNDWRIEHLALDQLLVLAQQSQEHVRVLDAISQSGCICILLAVLETKSTNSNTMEKEEDEESSQVARTKNASKHKHQNKDAILQRESICNALLLLFTLADYHPRYASEILDSGGLEIVHLMQSEYYSRNESSVTMRVSTRDFSEDWCWFAIREALEAVSRVLLVRGSVTSIRNFPETASATAISVISNTTGTSINTNGTNINLPFRHAHAVPFSNDKK